MQSKVVLLAEDDPDDALIFQMMFKRATLPHTLHWVRDGEQVIEWLSGAEQYADRTKYPLPQIVVLDLKMPKKTGLEALEWMRSKKELERLTTIILSSSDDQKDVARAYELGTTTYFVKSPQLQDVMQYLRIS
jgi:CheY-like chemotaxis protein